MDSINMLITVGAILYGILMGIPIGIVITEMRLRERVSTLENRTTYYHNLVDGVVVILLGVLRGRDTEHTPCTPTDTDADDTGIRDPYSYSTVDLSDTVPHEQPAGVGGTSQ